ncbi:DUF1559 domain-containing protein, partial [bacterium]|nr:DUF1559 domain-containing protein [bacterium]
MYEFPPEPWQSNTHETVGIHLFWLLVGALIMIWLSHPKRRPTIWDAAGMLFVGLVLTSLLLSRNTDYRGYPSAYPALIYFAWGMVGLAMIWNWYRLLKVGERWDGWFSLSAILTLLFLILCMIPPLHTPREASRRSQCRNNLKHIGLAFHNYHDVHERLPAQRSGQPTHSWRVDLLPFIDEAPLFKQYDFETEWNLGSNQKIAKTEISVYQCPSNPFRNNTDEFPTTAYVALVGPGTILQPGESLPLSEVIDGTSNTLLAVEACGLQIPWCKPQDVQLAETELLINGP